MKVFMVLVLVAVLASLASAGFFMLKRRPDDGAPLAAGDRDRRMARALAVRVALCVTLFVIILAAWAMGWLRPGGLPVPV